MADSLLDYAREECELAPGVALWDVSDALPRKPHRGGKDRRPRGAIIDRIFTHHSGAFGPAGFRGALAATRYVMSGQKKGTVFPGAPYHLWLPWAEVRDPFGRLVVFRLHEDEYRAWHTGGVCNDTGIGVAWQGQLNRTLEGFKPPSPAQIECAEALYPWLLDRYALVDAMPSALSYHAEADLYGGSLKTTCPGPDVIGWVEAYREGFAPLPAA